MVWKVYKVHCKKGLQTSQSDRILFIKHSTHENVFALIVYVDHIVVTQNNLIEIGKLKSYLEVEFEIKYLGSVRYFLGIEVAKSKQGIFISQQKCVGFTQRNKIIGV